MKTAILSLSVALCLSAFPSVEVGMSRETAFAALKKDSLQVCDREELPEPDPRVNGGVSGIVACRSCPCPPRLASLLVWFGKNGRVTSVAVAHPRER